MLVPWIRGRTARQAHVGVPEGTFEEEYARDGFSGGYAHLYRKHPPVGWTRIEGPLRPRAFDGARLDPVRTDDGDATRASLFENDDAKVGLAALDRPMPFFVRDADADALYFVHSGAGRLETDFGPFDYEAGDYLLVPRGTVHRFAPTAASRLLVVSTRAPLELPERGLIGQHALFDPAVVRVPTPDGTSTCPPDARGQWQLRIAHGGELTRVFYPFCPIDTVGWKGTLAPLQINIRDIRPLTSERYHLPPPAHATFLTRGASVVVCTFLPRPLENGDPEAQKVPFYHANVDYDEVLFYHAGDFFSRTGIAPGMLTLHPQGIHHGPQPGARQRVASATRTEEVAVMIDTRLPFRRTAASERFEIADYWASWKGDMP